MVNHPMQQQAVLQPGMLGQPLGEDQLGGQQLAAKAEPQANMEEHMDDMWNFFLKVGLLIFSAYKPGCCMLRVSWLAWAHRAYLNLDLLEG